MSDATEAEVEAVARALAQMARETIAAMDAVRAREAEIKAEPAWAAISEDRERPTLARAARLAGTTDTEGKD